MREGPHGICGSQRTPVSILLHVNQHAAWRTLGNDALLGHQTRVFGSHGARDDLAEGTQLLVCVHRLDRYIDVDSRGARSLQEVRQLQFFQLFMQRSSDGDDDGKFRAIRWIQIEEEVVRMLKVVEAIGPRIVADETEAGQKHKGSATAGCSTEN